VFGWRRADPTLVSASLLLRMPAITKPKLTPIESKDMDIKIVMAVPLNPPQPTNTIVQCRWMAMVQTHHIPYFILRRWLGSGRKGTAAAFTR
jgi:hypothetical protein